MTTQVEAERLVRWSEAGRCLRGRALRGRGYSQGEPSLQMRGWWKRGEQIEAYLVEYVKEAFAAEGAHWFEQSDLRSDAFDAVGHPDLLRVTPEKTIVFELKSSAKAALQEYHVWQTRAYMMLVEDSNPGEVVEGIVIACDPSNVEDIQHYTVALRPGDSKRIVEDWDALVSLVGRESITRAEYPERVCAHPGGGEAFMCGVVEHCFADWMPADGADVLTDPHAVGLVRRLNGLEARRKALKGELAGVDSEAKEMRAGLARLLDAGRLYRAGEFEVKRTPVRSERASVKALDAMMPREQFADAVKVSESERWTVKEVSEGA